MYRDLSPAAVVRLQTGEVAVVIKVVEARRKDRLDQLLGSFFQVLVNGSERTISAIDIAEVLVSEEK